MSKAYQTYQTYQGNNNVFVKRGVNLFNDRTEILVQDEIKTMRPSEIYWFMHTQTNIQLEKGNRGAMLTKNGKKFWVEILSPQNAQFYIANAEPLEQSPNPINQIQNSNYKKLAIHLEDISQTIISVWFVPLNHSIRIPTNKPKLKELSNW